MKVNFNYVRILWYIIILILLIYIAFTKVDEPCDRCFVQDTFSDELITCRQLMEKQIGKNIFNTSLIDNVANGSVAVNTSLT